MLIIIECDVCSKSVETEAVFTKREMKYDRNVFFKITLLVAQNFLYVHLISFIYLWDEFSFQESAKFVPYFCLVSMKDDALAQSCLSQKTREQKISGFVTDFVRIQDAVMISSIYFISDSNVYVPC